MLGEASPLKVKFLEYKHELWLVWWRISSEQHSLKSKALILLIIGHKVAIYSTPHQAYSKNICSSQKGVKCSEIARAHLSKITESAHLPSTEFGMGKGRYGGYITCHWNWMNSYWLLVGGISWRFSVSSFCDFWKMNFCDFAAFFSFLTKSKHLTFQMWFIRSTIA